MCDPECQNEGIYCDAEIYKITLELGAKYIGFYEKPTSIAVCPINGIIIVPENIESEQQLIDKFAELYS